VTADAVVVATNGRAIIADRFTGDTGTLLTGHEPDINVVKQPWTISGPNTVLIDNGAGPLPDTQQYESVALIDGFVSNGSVSADWTARAQHPMGGLVFRALDHRNYLMVGYGITGADTVSLAKVIGGTVTELMGWLHSPGATTHRLEVNLTGAQITVLVDGMVRLWATDTEFMHYTRYGFRFWPPSDYLSLFDDFLLEAPVHGAVDRVGIVPQSPTVALTKVKTVEAVAYDAQNQVVPDVLFVWSSATATTVGVQPTSRVAARITGHAYGTSALTATVWDVPGKAATTTAKVAQVARVAIVPDSVEVPLNDNRLLTARAYDSDDVELADVVFTWATNEPYLLDVNPTAPGAATAIVAGHHGQTQATVTATAWGTQPSASATVIVPGSGSYPTCLRAVTGGGNFAGPGGPQSLTIITNSGGCAWTLSTDSPGWLVLTQTSGVGSGVVPYTVRPNGSPWERAGKLFVNGTEVVVTQDRAVATPGCQVSLEATGSSAASGGVGAVEVSAPSECVWVTSSSAPWLHAWTASGIGQGQALYVVDPNPTASTRSASLFANGAATVITQSAGPADGGGPPRLMCLPEPALAVSTCGRSLLRAESCDWRSTPVRVVLGLRPVRILGSRSVR